GEAATRRFLAVPPARIGPPSFLPVLKRLKISMSLARLPLGRSAIVVSLTVFGLDMGGGADGRAQAQHPAEPYDAKVAAASPDGLTAIKRFRAPEGLEVRLFAAEPLLANPVAFASDERGRF